MGCNTSKDGSNPSTTAGSSSKAPTQRAEEGTDNNTNQGNNENFTGITTVDETGGDNSQVENKDVNNDGGQLIINEETEKISVKDHHGQLQQEAEEDNTIQDGDIVVENVEQKEVEADKNEFQNNEENESNDKGEQGAGEQTTNAGDGSGEEQKLDEV